MNINNAFPSKWLKSGDVGDDDLVLTISNVDIETVGQGDDAEQKPVVYFQETDKGLVLNKTNADAISKLHGPETDGWTGKKISLFSTEVDFGGKQTLALRVRLKAPKTNGNGAANPTGKPSEALMKKYHETVAEAAALGIAAVPLPDNPTDAIVKERGINLRGLIDARKKQAEEAF